MEKTDRDLWENLDVDFRIQSVIPSENKIVVSVDIHPEEASRAIKHLVLVNNSDRVENHRFEFDRGENHRFEFDRGENHRFELDRVENHRFEFDQDDRRTFNTGLDLIEEHLEDHIQATLENNDWEQREFEHEYRLTTPKYRSSVKTVNYEWKLSGPSEYSLILRWSRATTIDRHTYVICLDKKEIQYIREPLEHDKYEIRINRFKPGSHHHVEILMRLSDGQTIRPFKPLDITVPESTLKREIRSINLSEEPRLVNVTLNENDEERNSNSSEMTTTSLNKSKEVYQQIASQMAKRRMPERKIESLACGCQKPHEEFPGIDHYLSSPSKRPSSSISTAPMAQIDRATEKEAEHDDDNDVIGGE